MSRNARSVGHPPPGHGPRGNGLHGMMLVALFGAPVPRYAPAGPRLVHIPSEPSGSQRSPAVHRSPRSHVRSCGNRSWWRTMIRMRSLTSRASLRYPVSRQVPGAFSFLDFRHRICYGARGQDGFRDATREEERRRAPHLGEVVPIGSPCKQRRTCWGSGQRLHAPGPRPFLTGRAIRVPYRRVNHGIERTTTVTSIRPLAGRPRRTSQNASREYA
jgi:hypothetical protein